jgi:hypothetical protein
MPGETLPQPRHQPKAEKDEFGNTVTSTKSFQGGASSAVGLYGTPSYSSLFVEPEDLEPGPGSYDISNNFGHQPLSTTRSQPSLSMTARHDKSWSKVMITKDHLSTLIARDTPGPGTYVPLPAMTQSRVRFGTSQRRGISDSSFKAPGPVYDTEVPTGDHQKVTVKFSKASRFRDEDLRRAVPGPGDYPRRVRASSGKEIGSEGRVPAEAISGFNASRMAKSFGVSHRAYDRVWFPGSERLETGRMSPGPGTARPFQNNGKGVSFPGAPRMPPNLAAKRAPGPGAYDNHERENAVTESSPKFGMGRPNAKGRLNLKQMRLLTHTSSWGLTA